MPIKKIPLFLKILVPVFIAFAVAGAVFAAKLSGTAKTLNEKALQIEEAEAIPSDSYKSEFEKTKNNYTFREHEYESQLYYYPESEISARYECDNIEFISFSE